MQDGRRVSGRDKDREGGEYTKTKQNKTCIELPMLSPGLSSPLLVGHPGGAILVLKLHTLNKK